MKTTKIGMTISQMDEQIVRKSGTSAKTGNVAFLVARGHRHDYQSEVVSTHRTSRGAMRACNDDGLVVWQWDSYMNPDGGFRAI